MEVPIARKLKAPQTGFQPPVQLTLDQRATWLMSGPWESSKGTGPWGTDTSLWRESSYAHRASYGEKWGKRHQVE